MLLDKLFPKNNPRKTSVKKERRRSKRYRMDLPVPFRLFLPSRPETPGKQISGQMLDLSTHGLGLLTNTMECEGFHMMAPDHQTSEQCLLEILLPFDGQPLSLKGKAIWYVRNPEGHPFVFRVGIEFLNLTPDLRDKIQTFINIYLSAKDIV